MSENPEYLITSTCLVPKVPD